ncbi:MAG: beta-ketoacyl-ACP synthase II [Candidatus Aureabacteria bacterium]|nr:beta-ketoacyl-ACP synthase II [Candidatus Auribacterota bacterium]
MISHRRRVVITGAGMITPLGLTREEYWRNLIACRSGIAPISLFDVSGFPTRIAAEVKGFDPLVFVQKRKSLKVMVRDMQFAVAATREAMDDSGLDMARIDPTRLGVVFGAGMITADAEELAPAIAVSLDGEGRFDIVRFGREGIHQLFPLWLLKQLPNMLASHVAIQYNAQGPSNTITTGCSASAHAVGEAFRVIARGAADVVISGGASSSITPLKLIRYHALGVLSQRNDPPEKASCPFDLRRDGFVLGEGAGVVVLEEEEHARRRGARPYAELVGYGSSVDIREGVGRLVTPASKSRAIRAALTDARIDPSPVTYVCAHGNSIPFTDRLETLAIRDVWGERAGSIAVSSVKGHVGDLGPASGALNLITAVLAIGRHQLPSTLNYEQPDPECDLDYVPQPRACGATHALINSFDFMGQNVSLVVRKIDGGRA